MPNHADARLAPRQPSYPPPAHLLLLHRVKAKGSVISPRPKVKANDKGGAVKEEGKGGAVKDTSKEAKINLTEHFKRNKKLKIISHEWRDHFEAIAQDVMDVFKVCAQLPEERHPELQTIAKGLVDVFVDLVHAGEEVGVRTYKATRRHMIHQIAAQKKFVSGRATQKRTNNKSGRTTRGHAL